MHKFRHSLTIYLVGLLKIWAGFPKVHIDFTILITQYEFFCDSLKNNKEPRFVECTLLTNVSEFHYVTYSTGYIEIYILWTIKFWKLLFNWYDLWHSVHVHVKWQKAILHTWLIRGLRPANERRRYFVTTSLTGWVQALNQLWHMTITIQLIRTTNAQHRAL